jgi:hypothetical protein
MLVPSIYYFRLHKALLLDGGGLVVTALVFGGVAIGGLSLAAVHDFDPVSSGLAVALVSPAVHTLLFRLAHQCFTAAVGREPADVVNNFSPGLVPDRVFAFVVVLGLVAATFIAAGQFWWGISNG